MPSIHYFPIKRNVASPDSIKPICMFLFSLMQAKSRFSDRLKKRKYKQTYVKTSHAVYFVLYVAVDVIQDLSGIIILPSFISFDNCADL